MRVFGDLLKVNILSQLHILGVDTENFHSTYLIWDTDIDFSIETTSSSKGWVNSIRPIGGSDDDNLASSLSTIHESQKLGNDSLFSLSVRFLSVWRNGIDFINKYN